MIQIITPSADSEVWGETIISFNATDDSAIVWYEIEIDFVVRANASTYEWDTTEETEGTHTILCRARDNSSNWGEASISVTVNNTAHPNIAPVVSITAPTADSTISGDTLVTTSVVDEDNLKAKIYIDNEHVSSTGSFLWKTKLWNNVSANTL